jgi:hypothetical protein
VEINNLNQIINQLTESLSVYQQPDRDILNFKGGYLPTQYEYSSMANRNSFNDKDLDKLRKEKNNLEI